MRYNFGNDTIAALSTPIGEGGIGIIRLSGPAALKIADKIFISRKKKKPSKFKSHTIHYGHIVDIQKPRGAGIIDEALLSVMRSPFTYTREDIVEINCHGGLAVLRKILEVVIECGARPSEPGEFTKRAFLNGRIDLTQAEAVLDIIKAKTEAALRASLNQLDGALSGEIKLARKALMIACSDVEALIDFPDEDITPKTRETWSKEIKHAKKKIDKLLGTYHDGAILKEGITAVICGKPNVGKSSLLNILLKKDRAIVTHVPGTTRDAIEELASIKGIPLRLVDTAGIRKEKGIVEKEGIRKSYLHLTSADLILYVLDGTKEIKAQDSKILEAIRPENTIVVINKCDLRGRCGIVEATKALKVNDVLKVSCLTKAGIDKLEDRIYNKIWSGKVHSSDEAMINNIRHKAALEDALGYLTKAEINIEKHTSLELLAHDLRESALCLGRITGDEYTEGLLDIIFSRFCVGK